MGTANIQVCSLIWIFTMAACKKIPDVNVTCIFSMDCVLPCRFKPAGGEVIQWYRQDALVHSFYNGSDVLDQQDEHYRGRTVFFQGQLAWGNASLLLQHSGIEDKGRYRCHVHTALGDQDSVVIVKVEASMVARVITSGVKNAPIQTILMTSLSGYKEVTCSSQDIYPAPQLLWSTDPPAPSGALKPTTRKVANAQGLYTVKSMQKRMGNLSDFTYICTLKSYYGTQTWIASLREREISTVSGKGLTIPCLVPMKLLNFTLTWTLTRANKSEVILTFDSLTRQFSNHWKNRARVDLDQVLSGNGSLWLQNLERSAETGTYTCAFSASQIQHLIHNHVSFISAKTATEGGKQQHLWIIAVVIAVLALFITGMIVYTNQRDDHSQLSRTSEDGTELHQRRPDKGGNNAQANNQVL
ncbi:hypothetical protein ANANG_G00153690 [Anguilla anguilla]|uniref:Ig-like domain-containing protein n=1 Tax=Anguilla anguilla TaxID=7936 RepID=A0A9D3M8B6_ANGAN|nr:hypothetical protein ANANG_G00153690 [Anguilla anguilla]